ncbi:DUF4136 domain-containing protein [Fibrella sp. HMF5335]|uniref:DUF4136 domain-containing protein n=1 Tax=Fibrella rubiginis TaxID=2817060 RepID=A0A939K7V1_9BACT|nr:DUF4136 domain-containing protein [Fibrella rubiginis]MBO0939836.1 DUF4136 domain-containing protein [Fibrella rubiginis]
MKTSKISGQFRRPLAAAVLALGLGVGLSACTDNAVNNLTPADSNVLITNYDRQIDFSQYKTFSLPDSVIVESNNGYSQSSQPVEQQIVAQVAQELTNRGYTRVAAGKSADLGVAVTRVNNRYTGVTTNPYAGYGNYWGYGYGYGYSAYYPSYYQYYQVTDRYWRVELVDLKNRVITTPTTDPNAPQNQLRVIYQAELRGNGIFDTASINKLITDAFAQSTYLKATR